MNETTTTATPMPQAGPLKRCAIIGTAQSWRQCPWADESLEVWALNDAYLIGVPRANRWYDLHPLHQMLFRPRQHGGPGSSGAALDVPPGVYLRPEGHLEWLKTRGFPVYLQQARPDYPTSRTFPKAAVLEWFAAYWPWRVTRTGTVQPGPDYEVSTPAWMLMQALAEGYQEIHVYGIHLATEWEYVQQRPNFEFLLGIAAGLGRKVVLPESTPICRASYQYAFAPKADLPLQQLERQMQRIKAEGLRLRQQLATVPWYAKGRRADLESRLRQVDVELMDARSAAQRAHVLAAV